MDAADTDPRQRRLALAGEERLHDQHERLVINTHSFETFQILRGIEGFEEVALWAAYHHEEPDGAGYRFRVDAAARPLEARILRVADIFQAMVQDRPCRKGLTGDEVIAYLKLLVAKGRIDADIVSAVDTWRDEAMIAACPSRDDAAYRRSHMV